MWFAEANTNKIGSITTRGAIREFTIPTANSIPFSIAPGPDGNLWFTESQTNNIARITYDGKITEFPIPSPQSRPTGIAPGLDDSLWFAQGGATPQYGNQIGRIKTP